jgi:hypothetical protein
MQFVKRLGNHLAEAVQQYYFDKSGFAYGISESDLIRKRIGEGLVPGFSSIFLNTSSGSIAGIQYLKGVVTTRCIM